jgi:stress-induced morphogen
MTWCCCEKSGKFSKWGGKLCDFLRFLCIIVGRAAEIMLSFGRNSYTKQLLSRGRTLASVSVTALESKINSILEAELKPSKLEVKDTSGGCGAMFDIKVSSTKFAGQSLVAQHKMVTNAIKAEIKEIHGLTLKTIAIKE